MNNVPTFHMTDSIRPRLLMILMLAVVSVSFASAQSTSFPASIITGNPTALDFQLVTESNHAAILIDEQDYSAVKLCAGLFSNDVERVTGYKPR